MAITFNTNNTIVDSDSGFGSFKNDDIILVQGTTSNDGHYKIQTATAGTLTLYPDALNLEGGSVNLVSESASLASMGIAVVNYTPSGPKDSQSFPARAKTALYHAVKSDGVEEYPNRVDDFQWMQFERDMDRVDVTSNPHCGEAKHPYGVGMIKGFNTQGAKILITNDLVSNEFTGVASPLNTISDPVFTMKTQHNNSGTSILMQHGLMRAWGIDEKGQLSMNNQYAGTYNVDDWAQRSERANHSFLWNDMVRSGIKWFMKTYRNTYYITNDGKLWCSGSNSDGQAGESNSTHWGTDKHKFTPHWIRGASDELNNKQVIDFDANDANSEETHCVLITDDYKLYCWGDNRAYQCGTTTNDNSDNVNYPKQIASAGFTTKKFVACYAHGRYDSACTFAIEEDGTAWCWGGNNYGQLGIGNTTNQSTPQNPTGLPNKPVIGIGGMGGYSGSYQASTFYIMHDHTVWACGANGYGQLGVGNTSNQSTPQQLTALNDNSSPSTTPYVIKLITNGAGYHGSCCAIMSDWTVRTWGYNGVGQLGAGNTSHINTPYNPAANNDELWGITHAWFNQGGDYNNSLYLLRCDGVVFSSGYTGAGSNGKGHDQSNYSNAGYPVRDHYRDSHNREGYHNNFGEGSPVGHSTFTPMSTGRHRVVAFTQNSHHNNETATFYASEGGYMLSHGYQTSAYLRAGMTSTSIHMSTPQGGPVFNYY